MRVGFLHAALGLGLLTAVPAAVAQTGTNPATTVPSLPGGDVRTGPAMPGTGVPSPDGLPDPGPASRGGAIGGGAGATQQTRPSPGGSGSTTSGATDSTGAGSGGGTGAGSAGGAGAGSGTSRR